MSTPLPSSAQASPHLHPSGTTIAAGYFTVVCTFPYEGPSEEQLQAMEEEAARRAEEEAILREEAEEQRLREEKKAMKRANREAARDQAQMQLLCDLCDRCPGFESHTFKPTLCKECGHPKNKHNRNKDGSDARAEQVLDAGGR